MVKILQRLAERTDKIVSKTKRIVEKGVSGTTRELSKRLPKKMKYKKILKTERPTITIHQKEVPKVLNDPNRFFKDEMEETKRSMFLK